MPIINRIGSAAARAWGFLSSSLKDIYFNYVTLLLNTPTTNTAITDASTNNFNITSVGDTRASNFSPYLNCYSYYYNGSSWTSNPSSSAFAVGTNLYTIEFWAYFTSTPNTAGGTNIFGVNATGGWIFGANATNTYVSNYGIGTPVSAAYTLPTNTWLHIAIARGTSNSSSIWVNGTRIVNVTDSYNYAQGLWGIGGNPNSNAQYISAYISNGRVVLGYDLYGVNNATISVPTSPLTAVTGTTYLTAQSNRFIDNSSNSASFTLSGSPQVQSYNPFNLTNTGTTGSVYYDGTGDYINAPNNSAFVLGSGDFTIEAWVYQTSTPASNRTIFGTGSPGYSFYINSSNQLNFVFEGVIDHSSSTSVPLASWVHLAASRASSTLKMFINGTQVYTASSSTSVSSINLPNSGTNLPGYISDLRVIKGTGLYTANFTPPTSPLTAVANTQLLTCQTNQGWNNNSFLDTSTNNFLITKNGNATQGSFSPFSQTGWSTYFNKSSSLQIPSNSGWDLPGDFSIEAWVNANSISGNYQAILVSTVNNGIWFGYLTTGLGLRLYNVGDLVQASTAPTNGQWYHVVATRSGSTVRLFINGVLTATTTNSTSLVANTLVVANDAIGTVSGAQAWNGYISNIRIVKGSIPTLYQTSSTTLNTTIFSPPTSPLTAITGTTLLTCQSNSFIDNSQNAFSITTNGSPQAQSFSPFPPQTSVPITYSGYFDGSGDSLQAPSGACISGTGDFTVECWIYPTTVPASYNIIGCSDTTNGLTMFGLNANGTIFYGRSLVNVEGTTTNTCTYNTWNHIAISRSSGTIKMFINGVQGYSASGTYSYVSGTVRIGTDGGGAVLAYTGYISNFRIIQGSALYTSNFTPSTTPLTAVSGTSLLTCQSSSFIDNSSNAFTISAFGNSIPRTFNPFGNTVSTNVSYSPAAISGSGYFDGSGDYLYLNDVDIFNFDTKPFTVECWVYPTASVATGYYYVISKWRSAPNKEIIFGLASNNGTWSYLYTTDGGTDKIITDPTAIVPYCWTHYAVSRTANTISLFRNGVRVATTTETGSLYNTSGYGITIAAHEHDRGSNFPGYVAGLRAVRGTAVYDASQTGFSPPVIPITSVANTTLLLNFTNSSSYDATSKNNFETVADTKASTIQYKYSPSSVYFDGSDYLIDNLYTNQNYALGSGNWTIEGWFYNQNVSGSSGYVYLISVWGITSQADTTYSQFVLRAINNNLEIVLQPTGGAGLTAITGTGNGLTANTWQHLAAVRNGNNVSLYINGTSVASTTYTATLNNPASRLVLGAQLSGGAGTYYYTGYMDDIRITKGIARYTSNFSPSGPFPTS